MADRTIGDTVARPVPRLSRNRTQVGQFIIIALVLAFQIDALNSLECFFLFQDGCERALTWVQAGLDRSVGDADTVVNRSTLPSPTSL